MTDEKLVSVLIPVYNVEFYVKDAIESIQNQTYKNLEIIVVDDASTDNTYDVVEKLAKDDRRIKLYKNESNLRIVKTLNYALTLANGYYIARMDGDDISAFDRIEKKVKFLEESSDIDLVGCSLVSIDSNGEEIKRVKKLEDFDLIKKTLRYTSPISHIWVCKKTVYEKLGGYRELSGAEDYDFILRLISSGMKSVNISNYYGYYVRVEREGNTVSSTGLLQKKLHEEIYNMYLSRVKNGSDKFGSSKLNEPYNISNYLYIFANNHFNKARVSYTKSQYLKMLAHLSVSLVSPHQLHMYYLRFLYKIKVRGGSL